MFATRAQIHTAFQNALTYMVCEGEVEELIAKHASVQNPGPFALKLMQPQTDSFTVIEDEAIFFDDEHALVLLYGTSHERVPIAVAGFRIQGPRPGTPFPPYRIAIHQLQGRSIKHARNPKLLRRVYGMLAWEQLLVEALARIGVRVGSPELTDILIRRALHCDYYSTIPYEDNRYEGRNERIVKRYDDTARALGFRPRGMYFGRSLAPPPPL